MAANTYGGSGKKVTARQMKRTIMSANDWNEDQYRKQYDLFKNKLRFYENLQRSRGLKVDVQSPQEVLYAVAKAKQHYGSAYEPSQEMQQILSVSAHSITKGKRIASSTESAAYKKAVSRIVNIRFSGFVDYYDKAKEIVRRISDPAKQEKALSDFANWLHEKYPRSGKDKGAPKKGEGGFKSGETYGSDVPNDTDFNIEDYIDDEDLDEEDDEE